MSVSTVMPSDRLGSWTFKTPFYYRLANDFLERAKEVQKRIDEVKQKLNADGEEWMYISHVTANDARERDGYAEVALIMCCLCVESFLNFYGIICLGESFYKSNIERIGIQQKFPTLLATTKQLLTTRDEEINRLVKNMFEKRNQLVHPKAAELNMEKLEFIDALEEAAGQIQDMKWFFELVVQYDPAAAKQIEMITLLAFPD